MKKRYTMKEAIDNMVLDIQKGIYPYMCQWEMDWLRQRLATMIRKDRRNIWRQEDFKHRRVF